MSEPTEQIFRRLMKVSTVSDLDSKEALFHIGQLIDASGDLAQESGWAQALRLSEELEPRLSSSERAVLHYFRGNVSAGRHALGLKTPGGSDAWAWEQAEIEERILSLRRALREPDFAKIGLERRCQIFVNLANALSEIGRFVEALEYWTKAINLMPDFAMALGNRGMGLRNYARYLQNHRHVQSFARSAQRDLDAALSQAAAQPGALHPSAKIFFERDKGEVNRLLRPVTGGQQFAPAVRPLGRGKIEQHYRRWCLANRLFLNPLNDLGEDPIAARDELFLPDHRAGLDDPPTFVSFFNQIKQEFVAARFLYYEGVTSDGPHFADRDVRLLDTLDYPVHSLAAEKVRLTFRASYSIFDKIAVFLNAYLALGIAAKQVDFRTLWYEPKKKAEPSKLRSRFERYKNLPLRGLFSLSKDLATDKPGMRDAIEPDARDLQLIRNHLEHKFLTLHEEGPQTVGGDDTAYALPRIAFEEKTFRLLKLVRAAITYLSLGMQVEERLRRKGASSDAIFVAMQLPDIVDRFKRRH